MTSRNKTKPTITVEAGVHPAPDTERRLRRLAALLLGRMERVDGVASLRAQRVEIRCEGADEPIQADGDPAGQLPAEIVMEDEPVPMRVADTFQ